MCSSTWKLLIFLVLLETEQSGLLIHFTKISPFRYEFEWKTPVACLPNYKVECSLFLNGHNEDEMYDLSVLSRWDNNWRALIDSHRVGYPVNRKIFINICRNIVSGNGAEDCPHDSGICMIRGSQK